MKNVLKIGLSLVLMFGVFNSCEEDGDESLVIEGKNEILETFTSKLPENVVKIQTVTSKHSLLKQSSLISKKMKEKSSSKSLPIYENAIYYFTNNAKASLVYDGIKVYATVFDENGFEINNIVADFSKVDSENIVTIKYLNRDETEVISTNSSTINKGWGSCMDDAIDSLYDDWTDDPWGTTACWLTGPLCAVGGGIACGIQQL